MSSGLEFDEIRFGGEGRCSSADVISCVTGCVLRGVVFAASSGGMIVKLTSSTLSLLLGTSEFIS